MFGLQLSLPVLQAVPLMEWKLSLVLSYSYRLDGRSIAVELVMYASHLVLRVCASF